MEMNSSEWDDRTCVGYVLAVEEVSLSYEILELVLRMYIWRNRPSPTTVLPKKSSRYSFFPDWKKNHSLGFIVGRGRRTQLSLSVINHITKVFNTDRQAEDALSENITQFASPPQKTSRSRAIPSPTDPYHKPPSSETISRHEQTSHINQPTKTHPETAQNSLS